MCIRDRYYPLLLTVNGKLGVDDVMRTAEGVVSLERVPAGEENKPFIVAQSVDSVSYTHLLKNFAFLVRVFSIFCTYISERVFKPHFKKSREEVQTKCTIPQDLSLIHI